MNGAASIVCRIVFGGGLVDLDVSSHCSYTPFNPVIQVIQKRLKIRGKMVEESRRRIRVFTYRTTRGNQKRYRDLFDSHVSPIALSASISIAGKIHIPKATERSRTRPLRSICSSQSTVHSLSSTGLRLFRARAGGGCCGAGRVRAGD